MCVRGHVYCVLWVRYMCVRGVNLFSLSTIFLLDFGTVPTVWYFFVFHFIFSPLNLIISNLINSFSSGVAITTSSAECARHVA
jgi:hypothetical protein